MQAFVYGTLDDPERIFEISQHISKCFICQAALYAYLEHIYNQIETAEAEDDSEEALRIELNIPEYLSDLWEEFCTL